MAFLIQSYLDKQHFSKHNMIVLSYLIANTALWCEVCDFQPWPVWWTSEARVLFHFFHGTTVQYKRYPLLSYSVTPFTAEGRQVWNNKEAITTAPREQSPEILYRIRPAKFIPRATPQKTDPGKKRKKDGQLEKTHGMVLTAHWSCQMSLSVVISHVRRVYAGKHLVTVKCGYC